MAIPPQHLDPIASSATKHKQLTRERILGQCCLHKCRQTIKTFAHIGDASNQPNRRVGGAGKPIIDQGSSGPYAAE